MFTCYKCIVSISKKLMLKSLSRYIFNKMCEISKCHLFVNVTVIAWNSLGINLIYISVGFLLQLCIWKYKIPFSSMFNFSAMVIIREPMLCFSTWGTYIHLCSVLSEFNSQWVTGFCDSIWMCVGGSFGVKWHILGKHHF